MADMYRVTIPPESSVREFEELLLHNAQQEATRGTRGRGLWTIVAEHYLKQKERLEIYPLPDEFNIDDDEVLPDMKYMYENTVYPGELIRWGLKTRLGNFRILYIIHNYAEVVLLHQFEKNYNGSIKRVDIEPAEKVYFDYMVGNPSHYHPTI
jgi:hypothetical protein